MLRIDIVRNEIRAISRNLQSSVSESSDMSVSGFILDIQIEPIMKTRNSAAEATGLRALANIIERDLSTYPQKVGNTLKTDCRTLKSFAQKWVSEIMG